MAEPETHRGQIERRIDEVRRKRTAPRPAILQEKIRQRTRPTKLGRAQRRDGCFGVGKRNHYSTNDRPVSSKKTSSREARRTSSDRGWIPSARICSRRSS